MAAAKRSCPTSKVRGGNGGELPCVQGLGWRPRGATQRLRAGAVAGRSNPTSKEWWLLWHRRAERSHPTLKVRKGGYEVISFFQGKEQWTHFAGAAVKRCPSLR